MSEEGKEHLREELPERWSAQRKMEVVLRLLRCEDLKELSREVQVPRRIIHHRQRAVGRFHGPVEIHVLRDIEPITCIRGIDQGNRVGGDPE